MSESHVLTADSLQDTARVQQESPFLTDNTDALKAYQKNTYTKFRSFLHEKPPCSYPGGFSLQVISQHPAKYQPTNLFQGLIILLVTEGIPEKKPCTLNSKSLFSLVDILPLPVHPPQLVLTHMEPFCTAQRTSLRITHSTAQSLAETLTSRGVVMAAVDVDDLNGGVRGAEHVEADGQVVPAAG
jgi:hypothetical protein